MSGSSSQPTHEVPNTIQPRARPLRSPSRRRPDKSWRFNQADIVERMLQSNGHRLWGYVVYRTTYASDDDWAKFLRMLRHQMERTFDKCNGRDILDLFRLTVFSDRDRFDGASTSAIRAHFREWAESAVEVEQTDPDSAEVGNTVRMGRSPRYHFCIQVDEASLHSVVHEAPANPRRFKQGWVKLINKSWLPWDEDPLARGRTQGPIASDPIEGVTERDVGWMKVPYKTVMLEYYSGEEGLNGWRLEYCRPPQVVGPPYDE